jgi:hypothetical protein
VVRAFDGSSLRFAVTCGVTPTPRSRNDLMVRDSEIGEINGQLGLGAGKSGFRFFHVHDAFVCGHHTPCALYKPGNLHLTLQGYKLLSDGLRRFLDK